MAPRKIDKVGVEFEGGWDKTFSDALIEHDHSVKLPLVNILGKNVKHFGEIPSPPFEDMKELQAWMIKHYPSAVNATCGFHVHFSLKKNLYYSQLMDRAFFKHFRAEANHWGKTNKIPGGDPFWNRLAGQNKFCTTTFIPHQQSQIIIKEQNDARRYTMLNYCHGMHGTIECRLASMFPGPEMAFNWVKFLCDTAEEWLAGRPPEKTMTLRLKARDLDVLTEVRRDFDSLRKKA